MSTFADKVVSDAADDGAAGDILARFRQVAEAMAPYVPIDDVTVKRAAFFNADDSEASIVIQSLKADRRLNVNLWTPGVYGEQLAVYTIDENMKQIREPVSVGTLRQFVEWVLDI